MAFFRDNSPDLLAKTQMVNLSDSNISTYCQHIGGHVVPAPGTWVFDPNRCQITTTIRHAGLTKVIGHLTLRNGFVIVAEDLLEVSATAVIDATSIDTGDTVRDEHIRHVDRLNVARFPDITFSSTGLLGPSGTAHRWNWALRGDLTITGITQPAEVDFDLDQIIVTPRGAAEMSLTAEAIVNSGAFGLTWNQILETGGFVLGKTVSISFRMAASYDASILE